jgi:hypothetical protein
MPALLPIRSCRPRRLRHSPNHNSVNVTFVAENQYFIVKSYRIAIYSRFNRRSSHGKKSLRWNNVPPLDVRHWNRTRTLKAANAKAQHSWHEGARANATNDEAGPAAHGTVAVDGKRHRPLIGARFGTRTESASAAQKDVSANLTARKDRLSVRAENVLKELAAELTGENPPRGRWIPSGRLLRMLNFNDLLAARNCGPQTIEEIIRWANLRGAAIRPPFHAGKSLSAMWQDLIVKSSRGKISKAEIAEALEKSARRRNTRIPVAFQAVLVKLMSATDK